MRREINKDSYRVSEGRLCLSPEEKAEINNEDFREESWCESLVTTHVCGACDEKNFEEDMLEYEGEFWCKDCRPELVRCEVCGATYAKVSGCKECS